jgi:hypothetical protein
VSVANATSFTITNLLSNSEYDISISTSNSAGADIEVQLFSSDSLTAANYYYSLSYWSGTTVAAGSGSSPQIGGGGPGRNVVIFAKVRWSQATGLQAASDNMSYRDGSERFGGTLRMWQQSARSGVFPSYFVIQANQANGLASNTIITVWRKQK